jgi:hypothetical protein
MRPLLEVGRKKQTTWCDQPIGWKMYGKCPIEKVKTHPEKIEDSRQTPLRTNSKQCGAAVVGLQKKNLQHPTGFVWAQHHGRGPRCQGLGQGAVLRRRQLGTVSEFPSRAQATPAASLFSNRFGNPLPTCPLTRRAKTTCSSLADKAPRTMVLCAGKAVVFTQ